MNDEPATAPSTVSGPASVVAPALGHIDNAPFGMIVTALGAVCLSTAGILVRVVEEADGWQLLFYRGLGFAAMLLLILLVMHRGRIVKPILAIGWPGLLAGVLLGLGSIAYLYALLLTTVADAMFMISTTPFFSAVLGWMVLGDRIRMVTALAIATAMVGVGVMFAGGFEEGRWLGKVVALGAPLTFAGMVVLIRRSKSVDLMPANLIAGLVMAGTAAFFVSDFVLTPLDLSIAIVLGTAQLGLGFICITMGARHIMPAQAGLLLLLEVVLNPLWVWIGVNEVPSTTTLIGGGILFAAVIWQTTYLVRRERRARRARRAAAAATA